MITKKYLAVIVLIPLAISSARAQQPPDNKVLRAQSVFAEAENFELPEGWQARDGHGIDMYTPGVSGGKTVANPAGGKATLEVVIPEDGSYTMWMWLTKWVHDRGIEFSVEQDGRTVGTSTFNRSEDKHRNWTYTLQKGDNTVTLRKGPARLVLSAGAFSGYVGTPIDAVLLTKSENYNKPDWADFAPQTFARFTILTPAAPAGKLKVSAILHRSPWYSKPVSIEAGNGGYVPTGAPSGWQDISKVLDTARAPATATFTFQSDKPLPPLWKMRLELASQPDEKHLVRVLEDEWDGDKAAYIMPGDVARYSGDIESIISATARHTKLANDLDLPGGKGDHRPRVLAIEGSANSYSPRLLLEENKVLAKMGINSVPYEIHAGDPPGAGMDLAKSWAMHFIHDGGLVGCSFDPALTARLEKNLTDWALKFKATDPAGFATIRGVTLADEPGTPNGLTHIISHEPDHAAFREWLQARGNVPRDFGFADWKEVNPVKTDSKASAEMRRLGWLSSQFAQQTAPLPYLRATQILQRAFGRPLQTRVNFSDEALNGFSSTMSDGDKFNWFEFLRAGATTTPMSEDWLYHNPHLTPFLADLLRSTEATQSSPSAMYIIWGYTAPPDPRSAELRTMTALARGVKNINHYWYGPHYASTECAFSEDEQYVRSVARVNRIVGLADDVLGVAMPPAREVAILWSQATEQWKQDDAFSNERRMLHHALSMQQIPVDFIDEKDLLTRLAQYRVLYLPANNLPNECARVIEAWVQSGGTLVALGGGPDRDEINEPSQALWKVSGLKNVEMRRDTLSYRGERNRATATTNVKRGDAVIPVAGYKALLSPAPDAKVIGEYNEGGAAIVENIAGKGKVVTFGFNPGQSLIMAINVPQFAARAFWNVFPQNEFKLISEPVFASGVLPPVSTRIGIDAARLNGPDGTAVTLANFTLQPIGKLRVQVRGTKPNKVVSALQGELKFERTADGIIVDLPLEVTDVLKLTR